MEVRLRRGCLAGGGGVSRVAYLADKRVLEEKRQGSQLLKLTDGQSENAKIKGQNAKLWNPDGVGMGVLIVVLVGIIRGQIMVYVGSCQETGQSEKIKRIRTNPFDPSTMLRGGQAQDRFAGFFNRPAGQSFTEAAEKCTGYL